MKYRTAKFWLIASLAMNTLLIPMLWHGGAVRETRADVGATEELTPHMETLQHLSHKLGLAIQAKNAPLASFYIDEIGENVEVVQKKFPTYDKWSVSQLMGAMLVPSISPLQKSLKASNWAMSNAGYKKLLDSCNGCHAATEHAFIKIVAPSSNPFNQTFSPQ